MQTGLGADESRERRKRSIKNLQQLYLVVAGLALTVCVQRVVAASESSSTGGFGISVSAEDVAALLVFVVTIVPFFQGANVYFELAYTIASPNASPPSWAGMIDFGFFFLEALQFYAMAEIVKYKLAFSVAYCGLLVLDILWLLTLRLHSKHNFNVVRPWLVLNLIFVILVAAIVGSIWLNQQQVCWGGLTVLAVVRSVVDYWWSWPAYWGGARPELPGERWARRRFRALRASATHQA